MLHLGAMQNFIKWLFYHSISLCVSVFYDFCLRAALDIIKTV